MEKLSQKRMECFRLLLEHLAWIEHFEGHKRFKVGRESVRDDERCGRSKEVRTPELIGQIKNFMDKDRRVSIETSALFDVSVGSVHTIIRKELKMRKIWTKFVPRVLILVTDYLTKIGIKTVPPLPIVQTLLPVTFGYSQSSEAVVMRQLRRWNSHWHAHTRGLPWGLSEVVGRLHQVHCSRRRLLGRGLGFHVFTINTSTQTKNVWKLIVCTSYKRIT